MSKTLEELTSPKLINQLLNKRNTQRLMFVEQWPGLNKNIETEEVVVILSCTVNDCIHLYRHRLMQDANPHDAKRSDKHLLHEFMTVYDAKIDPSSPGAYKFL